VRLLWPQTKAGVVKLRQRTCLVQFRRKPGGGSPRGRAYVLLVERRSGAPPRERPVSWRSLASRSLEVLSSPRAPPIGPWTSAPWSARERAAARARLDAGEEVASVALSLGRSEASAREEMRRAGVIVRSRSSYLNRGPSQSQRAIIIQQARKGPAGTAPAYIAIARELQRLHPTLFGDGAPGMAKGGITRQTVRNICTANDQRRRARRAAKDGSCSPPAVDERSGHPAASAASDAGTPRRSPRLRQGGGAAGSSDDEEESEEEDEDEEAVAALVAAHAAVEWSERLLPEAASAGSEEEGEEYEDEEDDEEDDDDDDVEDEEEYEDTDEGAAAFFAAQAELAAYPA
jgi:predicted transcriptional regulator